jgi:acetylornithine deacetylase/succinyl-diaminopimelate desuccinylase family protein
MALPPPVELLQELVRRPSVNPMGRTDIPTDIAHESRVADYLGELLRDLGVAFRRHEVTPGRANLVAHFAPPAPSCHLLWEAHQDTVPVDGMTIDPFAGEVRDGRVWGRGACDVKGGITAMLSAFARHVAANKPGSAAVTLAFTIDEEHTFLGVQHLVTTFGHRRPDFAVVAEPTGLNVVDAHKGVVRWALETTGVAAHSSRPEGGRNAIYAMARVVTALEEYATELVRGPRDKRLGTGTLSVGVIAGGVSPNTVPDHCRVELDRRLLPGESAAKAVADATAFVRARCGDAFVTLPAAFACPPLAASRTPAAAGFVRQLLAAIEGVAGPRQIEAVPYGTDASTLAEAGIPAVVFGPGDIAQAHTKDEFLAIDELHAAVEILVRFAGDPHP